MSEVLASRPSCQTLAFQSRMPSMCPTWSWPIKLLCKVTHVCHIAFYRAAFPTRLTIYRFELFPSLKQNALSKTRICQTAGSPISILLITFRRHDQCLSVENIALSDHIYSSNAYLDFTSSLKILRFPNLPTQLPSRNP